MGILVANGFAPTAPGDGEPGADAPLVSLVPCLAAKHKETYGAAAEVLGVSLAFLADAGRRQARTPVHRSRRGREWP